MASITWFIRVQLPPPRDILHLQSWPKTTSGAWKQTIEGHRNPVNAVPSDGKVLASASYDSAALGYHDRGPETNAQNQNMYQRTVDT